MTILRKKILSFKIQKIMENDFVFFFQHNNIKNKEWVLLKNLILNKDTYMYVCKNKLLKHTSGAFKHLYTVFSNSESFNNGELLHKKALLDFLCQGPTVIVACNSINECKNICEILAIFKRNVLGGQVLKPNPPAQHKFSHKALNFIHRLQKDLNYEKTVTGCLNVEKVNLYNKSMPKKDLERSNSSNTLETNTSTLFLNKLTTLSDNLRLFPAKSLLKNKKLHAFDWGGRQNLVEKKQLFFSGEPDLKVWFPCPALPRNKCSDLYVKSIKPGLAKQPGNAGASSLTPAPVQFNVEGFFFIGGYMQKRFVDFLDLKKIYKTNEFLYSNLITQVCRPIQSLCLLSSVKTNFLYTVSVNNLITILQIRKKKLSVQK